MAGQAGGTARIRLKAMKMQKFKKSEQGNPKEMRAASGLMKSVGCLARNQSGKLLDLTSEESM